MAIWYDGSLTNFSLERSQLRTLAYLKKFGNSKWLFLNGFYIFPMGLGSPTI